jgi:hypothetical protein
VHDMSGFHGDEDSSRGLLGIDSVCSVRTPKKYDHDHDCNDWNIECDAT